MNTQDTEKILRNHNLYRRDSENTCNMQDPKEIGIAIDNAIRILRLHNLASSFAKNNEHNDEVIERESEGYARSCSKTFKEYLFFEFLKRVL